MYACPAGCKADLHKLFVPQSDDTEIARQEIARQTKCGGKNRRDEK